ncbi:MAG: O-antigen ligase family protein, partial [Chloroflexi bacterium]|nr:O-antigen ligase family protein [Chloroflexota bacterium]
MLARSPGAVGTAGYPRRVPPWVDLLLAWELMWVVPGMALIDVPGLPPMLHWLGWVLLLAAWPLRLHYRLVRRTPLGWPIAVFGLGLLVGLYASVDYRLSWEALQSFAASIFFYYAIVNQVSPRHIAAIVAISVAAAFAAIPWVFGQGQVPPSKLMAYNQWAIDLAERIVPRIGPYSPHMNALAGGLNVVIPLVVGVALFGRCRWLRAVSGAAALVLLATVLLSGSRGAWVGLTAAFFVLAALRCRWLFLLVPVGVAAAYALVGTGALDTTDLMAVTSGQTLIGRTEVWRTSFDMLADVPFTGVGLGSYPLVYSFYTPPSLPVSVTNPHNALIQVYADTGLAGVTAVLWGIGVLAWMAVRVSRAPYRGAYYGLAIGLAASLAGQMAYGVFESTVSTVFMDQSGSYHVVASPMIPML